MYEAARNGKFKGMYCIGYDPLHTQGDVNNVREAFAQMEMVVVQDIFLNKTCEMTHVVLPAACFYEKDGLLPMPNGAFGASAKQLNRPARLGLTGRSSVIWPGP